MVLGAGPAGRQVAAEVAAAGRSVGLVESREGERRRGCPPALASKSLLHSARRGETWELAVARRDEAARRLDRHDALAAVAVLPGMGRVTAPGRIEVGGVEHGFGDLVVCTGSEPIRPAAEDLAGLPLWTAEEALTRTDLPRRLVILGAGAAGCELAQIYAAFGSQVTLVESADRPPAAEAAFAGEVLAEALRRLGTDLRLGTAVVRAERTEAGSHLLLSDGTAVDADRVLVCGPRRPRIAGLGLEALGLPCESGLEVDARCQVGVGVWAAGAVTGLAPSAHLARYQARVAAANLLGGNRLADYRAIPRIVHTTPSVCAVGLSPARAAQQGVEVVCAASDLSGTPQALVCDDERGRVELYADRIRGVLIGAVAAGPYAEEWMGEIALAVRTETPLSVLTDVVHAFPTYGEAVEAPLRELAALL